MAKFLTELLLEPVNSRIWKVMAPFEYETNIKPGHIIYVKKGFLTDFATVPRMLWTIFPPWDKYGKAAVIHDYLYDNRLYERKICDKIFDEAMGVLKVPWWKRKVMYYSVRAFGWLYYPKKGQKNDI